MLGVFVLDPALLSGSGEPRIRFLHSCLRALDASMGGRLLVVQGDPVTLLPQVATHIGAAEVHISADYMPYGRRRDRAVADALGDVALVATGSPYAVAPGRVVKPDGTPYAVFTPFFRAWSEHGYRAPAGGGDGIDFVAALRGPGPAPRFGDVTDLRRRASRSARRRRGRSL